MKRRTLQVCVCILALHMKSCAYASIAESAGYANRVVMSQDYPLCLMRRMGPDFEKLELKWSITHIFKKLLPRLKELGNSIGTGRPREGGL
jgi:predicted metal-dependent phosphotriesterase family hydrolase